MDEYPPPMETATPALNRRNVVAGSVGLGESFTDGGVDGVSAAQGMLSVGGSRVRQPPSDCSIVTR